MEFAEKDIPGPRFRVTGLKTAGESGPLLKVFAVGATRICFAGRDIRGVPHSGRRELLEALAADWRPPLNLSPATRDREMAQRWFEEMPATGIEGLIIKGAAQTYDGGQRRYKVKHRAVLDVVRAAVIGPLARTEYVVAGLPVGGRLRIVGRSPQLPAKVARELAVHLRPPEGHAPLAGNNLRNHTQQIPEGEARRTPDPYGTHRR